LAVPVPGSIQWNSGRRPTKTWPLRVKEIELKRQKLERADSRLRRRYGTRWPKGLLNCFVERERALNAELEQVVYDEEDRFEPWFPVAIVRALDDALVEVTLESTPQLLEDLWKATHMLVSKRENRKRGIPVLTTAQARQLKKIKNAADRLTMACGPDWPRC
jgi:hypothetical protein